MNENLPIPTEFAEIATICVAAEGMIGNRSALTVNARDLHAGLQSKRDFSSWAKARIAKYGFQEGVDYQILLPKSGEQTGSGGHNAKEYELTLDMAKELSMVENNERGRLARRYFIWREQQTLEPNQSLTARETGGIVKAGLGKLKRELLTEMKSELASLAQELRSSPRPVGVAVVTHRTAKGWLQHYGVTKRRRGMSVAVSNALMRQSIRMGFSICYTAEEEKRSFHQTVADYYFSVGAGRHLLPKAVKGQKEMGLEGSLVNFPKVPESAS